MTRIFPYFSFTAIILFLSFDLYSIDLPDFTELAETHSPTVVNILSEKEFTEDESDDNSRENSPFFSKILLEIFLREDRIKKIEDLKDQEVQDLSFQMMAIL